MSESLIQEPRLCCAVHGFCENFILQDVALVGNTKMYIFSDRMDILKAYQSKVIQTFCAVPFYYDSHSRQYTGDPKIASKFFHECLILSVLYLYTTVQFILLTITRDIKEMDTMLYISVLSLTILMAQNYMLISYQQESMSALNRILFFARKTCGNNLLILYIIIYSLIRCVIHIF